MQTIKPLHADPSRWSSFDVQIWLAQQGFAAYVGTFRDNDVTGHILTRLSAVALRDELGVASPEDRERMMIAIRNLGPSATPVHEWTVEDVCIWLAASGMPQLIHTFRLYSINGSLLLQLKSKDLRDDLGIQSFGLRDQLLEQIASLKEERDIKKGKLMTPKRSDSDGSNDNSNNNNNNYVSSSKQDADFQRELWLVKEVRAAENRWQAAKEKMRLAQEQVEKAEYEMMRLKDELDSVQRKQANTEGRKIKSELFKKSPHLSKGSPACTFQPTISERSKQLAATRRTSITSKESPMKKKSSVSDGNEQKARNDAVAFFKSKFDLDVESDNAEEQLRTMVEQSDTFELTPQQKTSMLKMNKHNLAVALHNAFKVAHFFSRMETTNSARGKRVEEQKQKEQQQKFIKQIETAEEFLKNEFGITDTSDAAMDTLLAVNSGQLNLTATDLERLKKVSGKQRLVALLHILKAKDFLERTAGDMQQRQHHLRQLNAAHEEQIQREKNNVFKIKSPPDVTKKMGNFFQRYETDIQQRIKNFESLSKRVESVNEQGCTFHPCTTVNGGMQFLYSITNSTIQSSPSKSRII